MGTAMTARILVIEDQEDNRAILRDLLTASGYELIEAQNGEEGVQAAEREHPDLILMDIQLPIIAVTSYALSGDEAKARAAGCDDYVTKPFSPRALLAKVRQHLPGGG